MFVAENYVKWASQVQGLPVCLQTCEWNYNSTRLYIMCHMLVVIPTDLYLIKLHICYNFLNFSRFRLENVLVWFVCILSNIMLFSFRYYKYIVEYYKYIKFQVKLLVSEFFYNFKNYINNFIIKITVKVLIVSQSAN